MEYELQLQFLRRMMNQLDLPCTVMPLDGSAPLTLDMGLRSMLGKAEAEFRYWYGRAQAVLREKTVYHITDEFCCRYIVLLMEGDPTRLLAVGPYTSVNVDREWIQAFMAQNGMQPHWLPILESYYHRVRCLSNDQVAVVAIQALAEHMWGAGGFKTEYFDRGVPESWGSIQSRSEDRSRDDILDRVSMIERRYEAESRLMELVKQGRGEKVKLMLGHFSQAALERRAEPTRDVRNYTIILNTLMRKAAQSAGVHPIHIDRISSEYAGRIESITKWEGFMELWGEMALGYCSLVRRHATARFSPMIRKVITRIDFDLSADLSLRATADALNVNASYLSSHFKAETGETLTDYVNKRRMEHAAYLLTTTDSAISTIAQTCGISDDNYFIKIFKRHNGLTPRQFRIEQRFGKKT